MPELSLNAVSIVLLRLFDVAHEIDLDAAARGLTAHGIAASRTPVPGAAAQAEDPLSFPLPDVHVDIGDAAHVLCATVRCFGFGVISISLQLDYAPRDGAWDDLAKQVETVDRALGARGPRTVWDGLLARVNDFIADARRRPSAQPLDEDYLVVEITDMTPAAPAEALLDACDVDRLLAGEERALSRQARAELLRRRHSWHEDDLIIVSYDRALIIEPRGDPSVLRVLEVANAQLLEKRYYDGLLSDEVPRMYDAIERANTPARLLASRRAANTARALSALVAEITEVNQRADAALRFAEDVFLSRVYRDALDVFRVPEIDRLVSRKLEILRDAYAILYGEASRLRGELMELAIILLIALEIVLAVAH